MGDYLDLTRAIRRRAEVTGVWGGRGRYRHLTGGWSGIVSEARTNDVHAQRVQARTGVPRPGRRSGQSVAAPAAIRGRQAVLEKGA